MPASLALAALCAGRADGQAGLTHAENAVPVPQGMLRLSVTPSWGRYDARFAGDGRGTEPLGAALTSPALGTAQIPALTRLEEALRALTGDAAFRLTLGEARAFGSMRVVTTPIRMEYGLRRRVSIGVTVPIVQVQRELLVDLAAVDDPSASPPIAAGNVGPSAAAIDPQVYAQAAQIASEVAAASIALVQRIGECRAAPATSGCEAINADPSGAAATVSEGTRVAFAVRYVYGTSPAEPGIGLVPRTSLAATIAAQLQALNARFATYLGGTPIPTQSPPRGAAGPVASGDLRRLARSGVEGIGPDSLARISSIGIGDVEVGARVLLWDSRASKDTGAIAPRGIRMRAVLGLLGRIATGEPARDDELFMVGTGDGQHDAEASLAVDIESARRFGATVAARYTAQLGTVAATRAPDARGGLSPFGARGDGTRSPGDVVAVELSPRVKLATSLFAAVHYGLIVRGDDAYRFPRSGVEDVLPLAGTGPLPEQVSGGGFTEQRAGVSLSYSTVAEWERGRVRLPVEVSYAHLETIRGSSAMVSRAGRDQIQLRVYYRLRR